jgi:hypothetical protein
MATTMEKFLATTALAINTFAILVMYFVSNSILGPIVDIVDRISGNYPQVFPVSDTTYIIGSIWTILFLFEIMCVIGFVVVVARRSVVDDYV